MPRTTSNDTTFAVAPPPAYSWWLLIAMLAIPVIVVAAILAFDEDAGADGRIALAVDSSSSRWSRPSCSLG